MGSVFTHTIRHMFVGDHKISYPAIECPVLAHFGPVPQESVVRTSPAVRSSERRHSLHDLDNGQTAS